MNFLDSLPSVTEICFSPQLQFKCWAIADLFTFSFPEGRSWDGRWGRRSLLALLQNTCSGLSSEIWLNACSEFILPGQGVSVSWRGYPQNSDNACNSSWYLGRLFYCFLGDSKIPQSGRGLLSSGFNCDIFLAQPLVFS